MQATLIGFGAIFALAWLWDQLPHKRRSREYHKEYAKKYPPATTDWGGLSMEEAAKFDEYAKWSNPYDQPSMDETPPRDDRR